MITLFLLLFVKPKKISFQKTAPRRMLNIYKKEDCDCRYCLYCRRRKCRTARCCCLEDKIRTRSPVLNENDKEIYEFYTKGKNEHESNHHKKRSDRRS